PNTRLNPSGPRRARLPRHSTRPRRLRAETGLTKLPAAEAAHTHPHILRAGNGSTLSALTAKSTTTTTAAEAAATTATSPSSAAAAAASSAATASTETAAGCAEGLNHDTLESLQKGIWIHFISARI